MQTILDTIVTLVGLATVGQYAWSLRAHFASDQVPTGTKVISLAVVLSLVSYLYLQWTVEQPAFAQIIGLLLMLASLALFWAAIFASREANLLLAFDEKKPHGIVAIGPYQYVRHPFYLSYLIFWGAWAIASWHLLGALPFIAMLAIYVTAARGEEQKFENSPLAEDYRAYRKRAGFLWAKF
ncbi:methyltransferase family protein [Devosia sp. SL43]|uniref:methyltransferase family protein n=1 Tax=Devosia sp. SL43 TaxID=2806348 RepID=UPI001F1DF059|nr:isoprenylcysteine carboxylmethyltransferase family protein [Devosia sp. SL43]UJW84247.1 isoprenylcysteine carboxylmethyltransferase family protein [Devosia sp. SL43]